MNFTNITRQINRFTAPDKERQTLQDTGLELVETIYSEESLLWSIDCTTNLKLKINSLSFIHR